MNRTDSGYRSLPDMSEVDVDRFYEMFIQEFFEPPIQYEYEFGSFTKEDITELDNEIDELFEELFGEGESGSVYEPGLSLTSLINKDLKVEHFSGADECAEGEDWEPEMDYSNQFQLTRPVKNIPIGFTMNDISGRKFEEKVPLLKYFDAFEPTEATKGGFSKMTAKQKKKWKKKVSKPQCTDEDFTTNMNSDGKGRTYGRTKTGEIIILV